MSNAFFYTILSQILYILLCWMLLFLKKPRLHKKKTLGPNLACFALPALVYIEV